MIYSVLTFLIVLTNFSVNGAQFKLTDTDTYPMAHVNAILYALYDFMPVRNQLFSAPLIIEEDASEEDVVISSLQLLFSKIHHGGSVNSVIDLEDSYLSAEGFESTPLRLPRFYDPYRFYSWSIGKLARSDPTFKALFQWHLESTTTVAESAQRQEVTETEIEILTVDLGTLPAGHNLQNYLESLLVGTESLAIHQVNKEAEEKTVRRQTRFVQLPKILSFRLLPASLSENSYLTSWPATSTPMAISSSLRVGHESFELFGLITVSSENRFEQFLTYTRQSNDEWVLHESDEAAKVVTLSEIIQNNASPYMLFYAKPEFMTQTTNIKPSNDLELKSCATERLYSVAKTIQRSNTNTPPPASRDATKNKRFSSDKLNDYFYGSSPSSQSTVGGSSPFPSKGLPPLPGKGSDSLHDYSHLLISAESKPVLLETTSPSMTQCETPSRSTLGIADTTLPAIDDVQQDLRTLALFNSARGPEDSFVRFSSATHNRRHAESNYLFGWSDPNYEMDEIDVDLISLPALEVPPQLSDSTLLERHRQIMDPLRREISSIRHSLSVGSSPVKRVRKAIIKSDSEF